MDFIFYIIYNAYYKDGNYKNDMPAFTVFILFTLAFFCILLMLADVKVLLTEGPYVKELGLKKYHIYLLGLMGAVITYLMFYINKRYVNIYDTYKDSRFANGYTGKIIGWTGLFIMILSPFIFIYIRNSLYK